MNTKVQTLTKKELEELGEKLSAWAESDEFFEALETATVLPCNAETIARSNEILKAAGRGRPTLAPASKGDSPHYQRASNPQHQRTPHSLRQRTRGETLRYYPRRTR